MAAEELVKPAASLTSVMVKRKGQPANTSPVSEPLVPVQEERSVARPRRAAPDLPVEPPVAPSPVEAVLIATRPLGATATAAAAPSVTMRRTAAAATAVRPGSSLLTWRNAGIVGIVYLAALFIIAAAFNF
jgi:hypothetical protein